MSLTSLLKEPDVRERLDAEFAKPSPLLNRTAYVAPANPSRSQLVGTAFDYVLRLHAAVLNGKRTFGRDWIAEKALGRLKVAIARNQPIFPPGISRTSREVLARARRCIAEARADFEQCIGTGKISRALLRRSVVLGQLDWYFRSGVLPADFGAVDDRDTTELGELLGVAMSLRPSPFLASRCCLLNPQFGEWSKAVGGADADLVVDDTLIEIKTTKELEFTAETFRQLVGYYLLSRLGGIGGVNPGEVEIQHLGMYSSRFGCFASVAVASLVNPRTLPAFLQWFRERAARSGDDR